MPRMFEERTIRRAVDLQARGYQLLRWLESAFDRGIVTPHAAHHYASMADSALAWIERHWRNLPDAARPAPQDLPDFTRLFATYLTNTFDLELDPGERRYSPDAHCFCPICSWMVKVQHLRPKHLRTVDKKVAESLKHTFVANLAAGIDCRLGDPAVAALLREPGLRDAIGLCTYAHDLLQRLEGIAVGPASLALWRSFAWTSQGSPKRGFVLSAADILVAEQQVLLRIQAVHG